MNKLEFRRDRGTEITQLLFPGLAFEPKGSFFDRQGIDGYLDGNTIQLKFDSNIPNRRTIYHEIYEKSKNHPEQPWRKSPGIATHYIFTTETSVEIIGILISVDTLAKYEIKKTLEVIRPNNGYQTSAGFFIELKSILCQCEVRKLSK